MFDCFNVHDDPEGHFSAKELQACGIWIGYLLSDEHSLSYQGMPSFNQLKRNWSHQVLPHPKVDLIGTSIEGLKAVCRGCIGGEAVLTTLSTIAFVKGKVSIGFNYDLTYLLMADRTWP